MRMPHKAQEGCGGEWSRNLCQAGRQDSEVPLLPGVVSKHVSPPAGLYSIGFKYRPPYVFPADRKTPSFACLVFFMCTEPRGGGGGRMGGVDDLP